MKEFDESVLKPCPFCGSDLLYAFGGRQNQRAMCYDHELGNPKDGLLMWVKCRNCGGEMSFSSNSVPRHMWAREAERLLIERWNRRAV